MVRTIVVMILAAVFLFACDGFVGEASVEAAAIPSGSSASEPLDPRQVTARFEGADKDATVDPATGSRYILAVNNKSNRVVTTVQGVISVKAADGSDVLVNHPFTASHVRIFQGGTERISVDLPVASDIAAKSTLQAQIVSAEAP